MSGVKICAFCGKNFESRVAHSKFCSKLCQRRFFRVKQRDEYWEKKVAENPKKIVSAVCGYCGKSFRKSAKSNRCHCSPHCQRCDEAHIPFREPPKTYAQIRAENRERPLQSGWRGQKVTGGGSVKNRIGIIPMN